MLSGYPSFAEKIAGQEILAYVSHMATTTVRLQHERIDDIPLLLGFLEQMQLPTILEKHLGSHHLHQGIANGSLMCVWLAFILSEGSHCKVHVQDWAAKRTHLLEAHFGQAFRPLECSDDRLSILLRRLHDADWHAVEADLWKASCEVYEIPVAQCRLDSTTSYGYHTIDPDGLMQYGHSKDHRPDLPQLKLMAAAALPSGHLLATDIVPGNHADDPLYLPLMQRVRAQLQRPGLLYSGDCKMAALATRADIVAHDDYYLVPLPHTGETQQEFAGWVEAALDGSQALQSFYQEDEQTKIRTLLGVGYEFVRTCVFAEGEQPVTWKERVQIVRSLTLAQRQERTVEERLQRAVAAIRALTPPVGRGRRQCADEGLLQEAVANIVQEQGVAGLLRVSWQREESEERRYQGRGRGGPNRRQRVVRHVRYQITAVDRDEAALAAHVARLGWRVQATNVPARQLGLWASVQAYNQGWSLERDFHVLKDRPLGIQPLYVREQEQIEGLTRLLMIALRALTLFELVVRAQLAARGEELSGLYAGQAKRKTARPTAVRILRAIARMEITVMCVVVNGAEEWHVSSLPPLLRQILALAGLPETLYTKLATLNSG
jgi:transposase